MSLENIIEQPVQEQEVQEQHIEVQEVREQEPLNFNKPVGEMSEHEVEAYATLNGWHDGFSGANKKSAREFAEDAQKTAPGLAIKNRKLAEKVDALTRGYEALARDSARTIERQRVETERLLKEKEAQIKTAKDNLDVEAVAQNVRDYDRLQRESASLQTAQPAMPIDMQLWMQENQSWLKDPVLDNYAQTIGSQMMGSMQHLTPVERLERIKERVMLDLPEKFGRSVSNNINNSNAESNVNPNQQQAPRILNMNRTQTPNKPATNKLTIDTLPQEHKDGLDMIMRSKRFKTPEDKKAFQDEFVRQVKVTLSQKN